MTTTYYLWMQEKGGCDYTIGCGEKLKRLEAATIEDARVEAIKVTEHYGLYGGDHEAENVIILAFVENATHLYVAERSKRHAITVEDRKKAKIIELERELNKLKGAGT